MQELHKQITKNQIRNFFLKMQYTKKKKKQTQAMKFSEAFQWKFYVIVTFRLYMVTTQLFAFK